MRNEGKEQLYREMRLISIFIVWSLGSTIAAKAGLEVCVVQPTHGSSTLVTPEGSVEQDRKSARKDCALGVCEQYQQGPFRQNGVFGLISVLPRGGSATAASRTEEEDTSVVANQTFVFPLITGNETTQNGTNVTIPGRYLRMQKGSVEKARRALQATLQWRKDHDVDTILSRPHPLFDLCQRIQLHYLVGRDEEEGKETTDSDDKPGHLIFVQRPGFLNWDMAHRNNATKDDLLYHYIWVLEYCWNIVDSRPDGTMINILDLQGVTFGKVKEMMPFLREFISVMSLHYPQRSYKTLVINAPGWTALAYKLFSPLLRESTREKIQILRRNDDKKKESNKASNDNEQDNVLLRTLGRSVCPPSLLSRKKGGADIDPWDGVYESPMEIAMRQFCLDRLADAGIDMKTAVME